MACIYIYTHIHTCIACIATCYHIMQEYARGLGGRYISDCSLSEALLDLLRRV